MALAIWRLARRNAALRRLPSRLIDGLEGKRPGAVLVGAGGFGDEGLDGFDGEARGDLAGDVAAHAVGDDEEAEIGAGTVAILVAASAETGVRANGPGQHACIRRHASLAWSRMPLRPARLRPADAGTARRHLKARERFHERGARALVVDVLGAATSRCLGAALAPPRRARRRCPPRARRACARMVTRSGSTSANPNASDR